MSIVIEKRIVCDECGEVCSVRALESEDPRYVTPDGWVHVNEHDYEMDYCPTCAAYCQGK